VYVPLLTSFNTLFIDRTDSTLRSGQGQDFFGDLKYFILFGVAATNPISSKAQEKLANNNINIGEIL